MKRHYHYLVAGLPDIAFDDKKVPVKLNELKDYLVDHLHEDDWRLIQLLFYSYDNDNVLKKLDNDEDGINFLSNLGNEDLEVLFQAVKEDSTQDLSQEIPTYLIDFVRAFKSDAPLIDGKNWDVQLSELFYEYAIDTKNEFVANYFAFERDLNNIGTAIQCRKFDIEIEPELIGNSEINQKLSKSSVRDFGLTDQVPYLEEILKAYEETDILEKEKKLDIIRWKYAEEEVFFHYFTIEAIFTFMMKMTIVERWMNLDKQTGLELLNELITSLEQSYSIPAEI
ncbi:MAG: DUF2764 domain-containing protein [Bacteroidales bacterium]|nr:DUF2764 domain-containing protein [Bacteroidales bacterium]